MVHSTNSGKVSFWGVIFTMVVSFSITLALFTGNAAAQPQNNPGRPFKQLETKLDALESKLDYLLACIAPLGPRFVDRGLTVFDCQTGLEWEKKTAANVDDRFTWSTGKPSWDFDGTAADYIDTLNTLPCFAGHCDWRLPMVDQDAGTEELETILVAPDLCGPAPCISPIFGPTAASYYWSSVTFAINKSRAWVVSFSNGDILHHFMVNERHVRAVRRGP